MKNYSKFLKSTYSSTIPNKKGKKEKQEDFTDNENMKQEQ